MRTKSVYLAVVVAVLGLLATAVPADARPGKRRATRSEVTMTFTDNEFDLPIPPLDDPDTFSGEVFSSVPGCEKERKINVYRRLDQRHLDFIGSAKSDANGVWSLEKEDPADGTYLAAVTTKHIGKGQARVNCMHDRSPDVVVDNS